MVKSGVVVDCGNCFQRMNGKMSFVMELGRDNAWIGILTATEINFISGQHTFSAINCHLAGQHRTLLRCLLHIHTFVRAHVSYVICTLGDVILVRNVIQWAQQVLKLNLMELMIRDNYFHNRALGISCDDGRPLNEFGNYIYVRATISVASRYSLSLLGASVAMQISSINQCSNSYIE